MELWSSESIAKKLCAKQGHSIGIYGEKLCCSKCGLTAEEIRTGKLLIPETEKSLKAAA